MARVAVNLRSVRWLFTPASNLLGHPNHSGGSQTFDFPDLINHSNVLPTRPSDPLCLPGLHSPVQLRRHQKKEGKRLVSTYQLQLFDDEGSSVAQLPVLPVSLLD